MLYRPGSLPEFGNWAFKVKWDGFRTLVLRRDKSEQSPRVKHTSLLPELEALPPGFVLDGELSRSTRKGCRGSHPCATGCCTAIAVSRFV